MAEKKKVKENCHMLITALLTRGAVIKRKACAMHVEVGWEKVRGNLEASFDKVRNGLGLIKRG